MKSLCRFASKSAILTSLLALSSCSLPADVAGDVDQNIDTQSQTAPITAAECATVTANVVLNGKIDPEQATGNTFNNCTQGYGFVVDVQNLSATYAGTSGNPPPHISVGWDDLWTAWDSVCEEQRGQAYLYKKIGSNWTMIDSRSDVGVWRTSGTCKRGDGTTRNAPCCDSPLMWLGQSNGIGFLLAGETYRVASSIRWSATGSRAHHAIRTVRANQW